MFRSYDHFFLCCYFNLPVHLVCRDIDHMLQYFLRNKVGTSVASEPLNVYIIVICELCLGYRSFLSLCCCCCNLPFYLVCRVIDHILQL